MIEKEKKIVESTSSRKEECDSDEDMALFMKRFKRIMKKDGYLTRTREEARSRGSQTTHALYVGKLVISLLIAQT